MLAEEPVEAWGEVSPQLKSERMNHRGSAGSRAFGVVHASSSFIKSTGMVGRAFQFPNSLGLAFYFCPRLVALAF